MSFLNMRPNVMILNLSFYSNPKEKIEGKLSSFETVTVNKCGIHFRVYHSTFRHI